MKKIKLYSTVAVLGLVTLTGCGNDDSKTIKVGASATPHAEILEAARPVIEKDGYKLEVEVFDDYVLPNKALENGDIDANYFQHEPYLNDQEKEFGYDFSVISPIHLEPIGLYGNNLKDIKDLKSGAEVITSNSASDQARVLKLLADNDLIKLKDGVDPALASFNDISENPKELKFKYDYDPSLLPKIYESGEGDLVAINTNYALGAGIDLNTAVLKEGGDSDYANALVSKTADKDSDKIKELDKALHSEEVKDFIKEEYDGAIVAVDEK